MLGCKDESNMIKCKGIPDVNQTFSYMYFKTDNEGYLFGTYTEYGELSEKELENPNNIPRLIDEANIYKTTDGGRNWIKINSSLNYSYFNICTQLNGYVYIFCVLIKGLTNLKFFQNMPHSRAILYLIYIGQPSSSDV